MFSDFRNKKNALHGTGEKTCHICQLISHISHLQGWLKYLSMYLRSISHKIPSKSNANCHRKTLFVVKNFKYGTFGKNAFDLYF